MPLVDLAPVFGIRGAHGCDVAPTTLLTCFLAAAKGVALVV